MTILRARIVGVIFLLFLELGVSGQQLIESTNAPPWGDIWRDGIGSGFNGHTWSVGGMMGAGPGSHVLGSKEYHGLAVGNVNAAWILPEFARHSIFAGNLEFRGELFGGAQFTPETRYLTGLTIMARYDFATGTRWVPFADIGAGPSATDIDSPDLGGTFEFNVQIGVGTYYFIRKNTALSLEYRWFHISDAGITTSNDGVNTQMIQGGITWFF
ncbi:MAG TPA: acyloxyacyl hydrolase [Candidatus Sulfotelmatobacter sp.]|nr:acyloxyacyl hydrolase [Candidatus Sulfotelmatobacter sp.]